MRSFLLAVSLLGTTLILFFVGVALAVTYSSTITITNNAIYSAGIGALLPYQGTSMEAMGVSLGHINTQGQPISVLSGNRRWSAYAYIEAQRVETYTLDTSTTTVGASPGPVLVPATTSLPVSVEVKALLETKVPTTGLSLAPNGQPVVDGMGHIWFTNNTSLPLCVLVPQLICRSSPISSSPYAVATWNGQVAYIVENFGNQGKVAVVPVWWDGQERIENGTVSSITRCTDQDLYHATALATIGRDSGLVAASVNMCGTVHILTIIWGSGLSLTQLSQQSLASSGNPFSIRSLNIARSADTAYIAVSFVSNNTETRRLYSLSPSGVVSLVWESNTPLTHLALTASYERQTLLLYKQGGAEPIQRIRFPGTIQDAVGACDGNATVGQAVATWLAWGNVEAYYWSCSNGAHYVRLWHVPNNAWLTGAVLLDIRNAPTDTDPKGTGQLALQIPVENAPILAIGWAVSHLGISIPIYWHDAFLAVWDGSTLTAMAFVGGAWQTVATTTATAGWRTVAQSYDGSQACLTVDGATQCKTMSGAWAPVGNPEVGRGAIAIASAKVTQGNTVLTHLGRHIVGKGWRAIIGQDGSVEAFLPAFPLPGVSVQTTPWRPSAEATAPMGDEQAPVPDIIGAIPTPTGLYQEKTVANVVQPLKGITDSAEIPWGMMAGLLYAVMVAGGTIVTYAFTHSLLAGAGAGILVGWLGVFMLGLPVWLSVLTTLFMAVAIILQVVR